MSVVKINFKPISDIDDIQYTEQIALAVNCWSDDYVGKNFFICTMEGQLITYSHQQPN